MSSPNKKPEEQTLFPEVTGPSFSFALLAYKKKMDGGYTRTFSLYVTAAGHTWSEMLSYAEGTAKAPDDSRLNVQFNYVLPGLKDPDSNGYSVSTPHGLKHTILSVLRSFEENGPVNLGVLGMPAGANLETIKKIVCKTLATWNAI